MHKTLFHLSIALSLALAVACKGEPAAPEQKAPAKAPAVTEKAPPPPAYSEPAPPDVAAPAPDAKRTESGLAYNVLQPGTGTVHPGATDTVEVHYTGWMTNGEMFDSSRKRGQPARFPLNGVIKGWTEGLQLMVEGEKTRFWIPAELAYGDTPRRPGAPHGMLVFDVQLLKVLAPPPVPADVAKPPKDAKKTASGLAYKVLQPGSGQRHPAATDIVQVHYAGWTTDGNMFDTSLTRGQPFTTRLDQVIPGWTEGVQLMVEGEKTRFWIPGKLAYGDTPSRPGAPAGMLVFDVELLRIQ